MSGWKDWAIGEVVTESDFQSFVQDQVVQVYDDATDRDNTLGTAVAEGMVAYLKDTASTIVFDGSGWIAVGEGDITGVTAGTALTGGGVSGDVTLNVDIAAVGSAVTIAQSQVTDLVTDLGNKQDDVITTQGDLVTGDASGDPVRLAIGTADQVLTSDGTALTWADASGGLPIGTAGYTALSNGTAGISYQPVSHNYIINGAFDIWQRGDSFSNPSSGDRLADRYVLSYSGSGATRTISRQPVGSGDITSASFGQPEYFLRFDTSVAGSGESFVNFATQIEDVRTLAGQEATVSFYAKASSSISLNNIRFLQRFGSGGSSPVAENIADASLGVSVTTSWQRFEFTDTVPAVSGKTIGDGSSLDLQFFLPLNQTFTLDITGVQLEAGSVATPFKRNAPNLQGELAACQRYYFRWQADATGQRFGLGQNVTTGANQTVIPFPVTMRTKPTSVETTGTASDYSVFQSGSFTVASAIPSFTIASTESAIVETSVAVTLTRDNASQLRAASSNAFLGWSAEL